MGGPFHGREKLQRNYECNQNMRKQHMKLQIKKVINIEAEVSDEKFL